jgi:hypothetical protein
MCPELTFILKITAEPARTGPAHACMSGYMYMSSCMYMSACMYM